MGVLGEDGMTRSYTRSRIHGTTPEKVDVSEYDLPEWLFDINTSTVETLEAWSDDVTQHKIVNVAFGQGENTESFELSDDTKMVVTMDGEEVTTCSERFNLVDNQRVIAVLVDVLEELGFDDDVFGRGRAYKNKFVVDMFIDDDDLIVWDQNGARASTVYGFTVIAANDTSSSVKICPTLWDANSDTLIRGVGDGWKKAKHVKPEDMESKDMYDDMEYMFRETVLGLDGVADELKETIEEASNYIIDFEDHGYDLETFYELWLPSSTPQKIIDSAVKMSQVRAGVITKTDTPEENPEIDMWSIVSGFTYGYTHKSKMSDGSRKKGFHDTAIEGLEDPEGTHMEVDREYFVNEQGDEEETEDLDNVQRAAITSTETEIGDF